MIVMLTPKDVIQLILLMAAIIFFTYAWWVSRDD